MKRYSDFFEVKQIDGHPAYSKIEDVQNYGGPRSLPFALPDNLLGLMGSIDEGVLDISVNLFQLEEGDSTDWYAELKPFLRQGQKLAIMSVKGAKDTKSVKGAGGENEAIRRFLVQHKELCELKNKLSEAEPTLFDGSQFHGFECEDFQEALQRQQGADEIFNREINKMNLDVQEWTLVMYSKKRHSQEYSHFQSACDVKERQDSNSTELSEFNEGVLSELGWGESRSGPPNNLCVSPFMLLTGERTSFSDNDSENFTPTPKHSPRS